MAKRATMGTYSTVDVEKVSRQDSDLVTKHRVASGLA